MTVNWEQDAVDEIILAEMGVLSHDELVRASQEIAALRAWIRMIELIVEDCYDSYERTNLESLLSEQQETLDQMIEFAYGHD